MSTSKYRALDAGEVLDGRFELLEHVAIGGMGSIYRARAVHGGPTIAIKLMHPEFADDEEAIERFKREAQAVGDIEHPNVIQIYGHGVDGVGRLYLAMEWLEGYNIDQLVELDGPLEPRYAAWVALQTARALMVAHGKGVIHRDLKPENIFVVAGETPADDQVKVLDFGIAKLNKPGVSDITRAGFVCGTPEFMSPEQARGEVLDGRSDLYALGCVLYTMLTGQAPFVGRTPVEVMIKQQLEPLPALGPDFPRVLDALIQKATRKKREERQESVEGFAQQMQAFLTGAEVEGLQEAPELPDDLQRTSSTQSRALDPAVVAELRAKHSARKAQEIEEIRESGKLTRLDPEALTRAMDEARAEAASGYEMTDDLTDSARGVVSRVDTKAAGAARPGVKQGGDRGDQGRRGDEGRRDERRRGDQGRRDERRRGGQDRRDERRRGDQGRRDERRRGEERGGSDGPSTDALKAALGMALVVIVVLVVWILMS